MRNAVQFTEYGGITRRLVTGPDLALEVRNTGIGIPPEHLPRTLRPFVQGDVGTPRRYGLAGLGLAVARSLSDLMDVQESVRRTVGTGSVLALRMPWSGRAGASDSPGGREASR